MTAVESKRPTPASDGAPATLPAALLRHRHERPNAIALRQKQLGRWHETTWEEYGRRAAHIGAGLAELGVEPGNTVAIHADNRREWVLCDLAIQGIGAATVGVYPTNPAAEVRYVLHHSEAVVLIAEDEEQLDKALEVRDQLPGLRRIVVVDTRGVHQNDELVMSFADLEALGREKDPAGERFADRVAALDPEATAAIVYTSGTTGPPKGAILSHANLRATASASSDVFELNSSDEVLSYLPLCHVAERLISVVNALHVGYVVNFGESPESFSADLREVQPTFFLGVPRVWEKMLASVDTRISDSTRLKRAVFNFWTSRGKRIAQRRWETGKRGFGDRILYTLGWLTVFRSLREKLGLGRARLALTGAAPIAPSVIEFFWTIGIPVYEVYGQTESTGIATIMPVDAVRIGSVGTSFPGVTVRLGENDEVLLRGDNVFLGYFHDEAATSATIDAEGWLHTGDVGRFDGDYLWITDRMKDIIITAGGKNISPQYIENRIKVSPLVREAIVIGDGRKFVTALVGIELDTVGDWATRHQIAFTTYGDLATKPEVVDLISRWIDDVNTDLSQAEQIKRFVLIDKELDEDAGELTPTLKIKRRAISETFAAVIEGMYE